MVNVTTCDGCIHADVCCKKKVYEMFIEQVGKVAVCPSQQSTWYATDCNDVLLELKCKHTKLLARIFKGIRIIWKRTHSFGTA